MRVLLTTATFLLVAASALSQSKNTISAYYGATANGMVSGRILSDGGFRGGHTDSFGLSYTRLINRSLTLESGIDFGTNRMLFETILPGAAQPVQNVRIDMLTVPFIARYTFWRYFFLNGGLLAGFETNTATDPSRDQSGIGYELGLGTNFVIAKHLAITLNPMVREYAIIPFNDPQKTYRLANPGVGFGIGYNF